MKKARINIKIDQKEYDELKRMVGKNGKNLSEVVRNLIRHTKGMTNLDKRYDDYSKGMTKTSKGMTSRKETYDDLNKTYDESVTTEKTMENSHDEQEEKTYYDFDTGKVMPGERPRIDPRAKIKPNDPSWTSALSTLAGLNPVDIDMAAQMINDGRNLEEVAEWTGIDPGIIDDHHGEWLQHLPNSRFKKR